METYQTSINGVVIIKPRVFNDARGYFFESFSQREFDEKVAIPFIGKPIHFLQDNESMSSRGVMRGLHFQRPPFTQSKLVRCVKGAVLDVAVDVRKGSPTYGQHVSCLLCAHDEEGRAIAEKYKHLFAPVNGGTEAVCGLQFFVPRGFAHGFSVLSETAVFQYKCDEFYHPEADGGVSIFSYSPAAGTTAYNGEASGPDGIDWLIPLDTAILSDKDTRHQPLCDFDSPFVCDDSLYQ